MVLLERTPARVASALLVHRVCETIAKATQKTDGLEERQKERRGRSCGITTIDKSSRQKNWARPGS